MFKTWADETPYKCYRLPASGSNRHYFRISSKTRTVLGVYNEDLKENEAFISYAKHFRQNGCNVPDIYTQNLKNNIYLIEDLGDETLYSRLNTLRKFDSFPVSIIPVYKKVLESLAKIQIRGAESLDYSYAYPIEAFDKQAILWDLNYFKYYFIRLAQIEFNEQKLEKDFDALSSYLDSSPRDTFMYRDFQSRNIMLKDNVPYFIDFQGGRKGALQYDIASLLFSAKAQIPTEIRQELLEHYLAELKKYISIDSKEFIEYYYGFVLIRILQALGAYGLRGWHEKKTHFIQSIPYAAQNLQWLLNEVKFHTVLPELFRIIEIIINKFPLQSEKKMSKRLKITISSFSYKHGLPEDTGGHGGGFIFDCRGITNPGKFTEYRHLTGKDKPVIDFLENLDEAREFFKDVSSLIERSVTKYSERNFTSLSVHFGCTGGQHRSVYYAEKCAEYFKKLDVDICVTHREQDTW